MKYEVTVHCHSFSVKVDADSMEDAVNKVQAGLPNGHYVGAVDSVDEDRDESGEVAGRCEACEKVLFVESGYVLDASGEFLFCVPCANAEQQRRTL